MLRKMVKGGYRREKDKWNFILSNEKLLEMAKTEDIQFFIKRQQRNFAAHIVRKKNASTSKRLMFNNDRIYKTGPKMSLLKSTIEYTKETVATFTIKAMNRIY